MHSPFAERAPVIIENISGGDRFSAKMTPLPSVTNIDPRIGPWHIQVSSNLYHPDVGSHARNKDDIRDIKLHLRLSAIVDKTRVKWSDFSS
jgi:hypothetical protein